MLKVLKKRDYDDVPLNQLAVALGIVTDKALLLRGRATSIVSVSGRIDALHRIAVLGSRLDHALQGKDIAALPAAPGLDHAAQSIAAGNTPDSMVIDVETCEDKATPCETMARPAKVRAYKSTGKPRGRPRNATPGPTSGKSEAEL